MCMTTGAGPFLVPRHSLFRRGRPLAVSGSSRGWPACCVVKSHLGCSDVVCHCGGAGNRGLFAPQSSCPGSSWRQGHTCRTPPRACSVSNAILTIRKVPGWHVRGVPSATEVGCFPTLVVHHQATEVAVRAWLDVQRHWGPPCSDDLVRSSVVTRALVAGRAVT